MVGLLGFIFRALLDRRVPWLLKGLVLGSLAYSFFPRTWLPLGALDNLALPLVGLVLLLLLSPRSAIRELWARRAKGSRARSGKQVVDVDYRLLDDRERQ